MKCRICGCTDERGCPAGCCWMGQPKHEDGDLCSVCAMLRTQISEWMESVERPTRAAVVRLFDEATNLAEA